MEKFCVLFVIRNCMWSCHSVISFNITLRSVTRGPNDVIKIFHHVINDRRPCLYFTGFACMISAYMYRVPLMAFKWFPSSVSARKNVRRRVAVAKISVRLIGISWCWKREMYTHRPRATNLYKCLLVSIPSRNCCLSPTSQKHVKTFTIQYIQCLKGKYWVVRC